MPTSLSGPFSAGAGTTTALPLDDDHPSPAWQGNSDLQAARDDGLLGRLEVTGTSGAAATSAGTGANALGTFASQVVAGDFHKGETTWAGVAGNVAVGLIPGVGQIADARDTAAAVKNFWDDPSWTNAGMLGLAGLGWIPLAGDAIKGGAKVGKQVAKEGAEATLKVTKEGAEAAVKVAREGGESAAKVAKEGSESALQAEKGAAKVGGMPNPEVRAAESSRSGINWNPFRSRSLDEYLTAGSTGRVTTTAPLKNGAMKSVDFLELQGLNGGRIFASTDVVTGGHVDQLANQLLQGPLSRGMPVEIISGRHGDKAGFDLGMKELDFLLEDYGIAPAARNVDIHDAMKMSPAQMRAVLESGNDVILGWCHSENSRQVIKALGLNFMSAPF